MDQQHRKNVDSCAEDEASSHNPRKQQQRTVPSQQHQQLLLLQLLAQHVQPAAALLTPRQQEPQGFHRQVAPSGVPLNPIAALQAMLQQQQKQIAAPPPAQQGLQRSLPYAPAVHDQQQGMAFLPKQAAPTVDTASSTHHKEKEVICMPCKARGMPAGHNCTTAFFEVPKNAEHGLKLTCSFPACRNAGIRFLYCAYCRFPAAKRSFRTHHLHLDQPRPPPVAAAADSAPKQRGILAADLLAQSRSQPIKQQEGHARRLSQGSPPAILGVLPRDLALVPNNQRQREQNQELPLLAVEHQGVVAAGVKRQYEVSDDTGSSVSSNSTDESRRLAWDELLTKRPSGNNECALLNWMDAVLRISDPVVRGKKLDSAEIWALVDNVGSKSMRTTKEVKNQSEARRTCVHAKRRRMHQDNISFSGTSEEELESSE